MKKLFFEIDKRLLCDEKPSIYLNSLLKGNKLNNYPFDMLKRLNNTPQSKEHHPEGSVWNHTMMVVDTAAKYKEKSKNPKVFMWASLLHDIGKPETLRIRNGKITAYNHDMVGEKLCHEFFAPFSVDKQFVEGVAKITRWHMHILYVTKNLPFANIGKMKEETDISEIALFGLCDRLGREGANFEEELKNIKVFIIKCGEKAEVLKI
ncbi:MAG: HDIG domain-containing protein [Clostridiaceae bacterium]|nr:HDIG domain-containing protein [Clostridiaceae bacterium]